MNKMPTKRVLLGLVFHGFWLCYVHSKAGKRVEPLIPKQLQRGIVAAWNKVVCAIKGHDRTLSAIPECREPDGSFQCYMCCAVLR